VATGKRAFEMIRWKSIRAHRCAWLLSFCATVSMISTAAADDLGRVYVATPKPQVAAEENLQFQEPLQPTPDAEVSLDFVPIQQLSVDIRPKTEDEEGRALMTVPNPAAEYFSADRQGVRSTEEVRPWGLLEYRWEAPALCYGPLYFEEINVERYGNTFGDYVQPFVSAGYFYGTIGLMPLKMIAEPPCECYYVLGHYRPGRCVPFYLHNTSLSRACD